MTCDLTIILLSPVLVPYPNPIQCHVHPSRFKMSFVGFSSEEDDDMMRVEGFEPLEWNLHDEQMVVLLGSYIPFAFQSTSAEMPINLRGNNLILK